MDGESPPCVIIGKSGKIEKNLLFGTTSNRQLIADNEIECLCCARGYFERHRVRTACVRAPDGVSCDDFAVERYATLTIQVSWTLRDCFVSVVPQSPASGGIGELG